MASFDIAIALVLRHEGGFADHPADKGSATNFGISTPIYSKWLGRPATPLEVKNMTLNTAKIIYRAWYWNAIQGDTIKDQDVASAFMDMAVLRGVAAASKTMQKALGLAQDGIIGPKSMAAINAVHPPILLLAFMRECTKALVNIAVMNPTQLVFVNNWVARAHEITYTVSSWLLRSAA